jgi:potassium channel subfamily K, other eukaryote
MSAIDPGVEEGIQDAADEFDSDNEEQKEEADFLQPSHWWFASVACPLLAGTFGPMASGFNICALVQYWRQSIPPGPHAIVEMGSKIKDPSWLIIINAISLASAVTGNMALLLNMARRVKFSIAQPITIIGFLLAGLLLIADMAALTSKPAYGIQDPDLQPAGRHALTQAFYYAIWAAIIYLIVGMLMGLTVYGAIVGKYKKGFHLNPSQRTLMLQTMSFIAYLMLGALVFSSIEGWEYLDAIYWADVTLLTVGLGDYHPSQGLTRGLIFPFAIGGILMVGLVIGSIRSLILERGKEKMGARIVEKRRSYAVHNVDDRKQTIKVSMFAKADFSVDPSLSPGQKREEEFNVMRKVQKAAERERRWFALALSSSFALILWLVGAAVFQQCEFERNWTYLESAYFAYTSLLTIGYGDFSPQSNCGKAFFVFWSLLAVPSLTILISNMGDTIIKWFSDITIWVGSITVLPGEGGLRASFKNAIQEFLKWGKDGVGSLTAPGVFGMAPMEHEMRMDRSEYETMMLDRLAERLNKHVGPADLHYLHNPDAGVDDMDKDMQFYHYVLARECRNVQKDAFSNPGKEYSWAEWEYFLKLMGNEEDPEDFPGQEHPDILVPTPMRVPTGLHSNAGGDPRPGSSGSVFPSGSDEKDASSSEEPAKSQVDGNVDRKTSVAHNNAQRRKRNHRRKRKNPDAEFLSDWSWLSDESPLMSRKSEAEWILERLSAALERELNRQRKGYRRQPPIGLKDARRKPGEKSQQQIGDSAEQEKELQNLKKADKDEE